ncbi:MAG: type I restriction endonuclease subunit R [Chloroflexi bacterium]|nr:type I restriction endonuclease subunit R [Chloroflexota bacterium]
MSIPNERTHVELPLLEQLQGLGWQWLAGEVDVPYLTERESFRQVLLPDRLRAAVRRINLDANGAPWLDEQRLNQAVGALERLGTHKLMEANQAATELLLKGTVVEGEPQAQGGREQTVRFIDYEHPERNDFLAINQFRVDLPGSQAYIIPDIVLFVNGIPLVVIECKSPAATNPMAEGITQLLRYSNQRGDSGGAEEGVERLFHYNQFMVSTHWYAARAGTIGASYEHYLEWKDTSPVPMAQVAAELGTLERLSSQQILAAGMLRPAHLLDIVRHFTLFTQAAGQTIKIVARYQQFRAVQTAIQRLQSGQTRPQHGLSDQRGGIIWHTQGSGKSLTMVFLVRKLRTLPNLRRFKLVIVTDRRDLQRQLSDTAALTNETVRKVTDTADLQQVLREPGADLVFAMIQKYQVRDEDIIAGPAAFTGPATASRRVAERSVPYTAGRTDRKRLRLLALPDAETFPVLNTSPDILVLVDEAHRSQSSALHANLMRALPNCARIGFTGTPILMGERKKTQEIFGSYIDRYTIQQSEADGATVPILYEGRTVAGEVGDGRSLDQLFEDMFRERTSAEMEALKRKYATRGNVLEAEKLIAAKASDILRHYVDTVLPNGFKAQVVACSRRAAVRYQAALVQAHRQLLQQLEDLDPTLLMLDPEAQERLDGDTRFLLRAYPHRDTIRRLEFAAVISGGRNDPADLRRWSDPSRSEDAIARFKKPLNHADPAKRDGLAFLCVKSMLLTGFDAPLEQVLYLDRFMQGHELLQAIARVNRTAERKSVGLVVDYYGVGRHLKQALEAYSAEDIQGALVNLQDELPKLEERHRRVLAVFQAQGIPSIQDVDGCVALLRDVKVRAEFVVKLKLFLESLDIVLPRPEALPHVRNARLLGYIEKSAANLYRDDQLNLAGAGEKVQQLIDRYIVAQGVDPRVPPTSILDAGFESAVAAHATARARAAEMEHAARHHIHVHYQEDPAYYKKLSQRLEEILQRYQDNWDEQEAALRPLVRDMRQGRPADQSGLDPQTQAPFWGLLVEEVGGSPASLAPEKQAELAGLTVELVEHIRQEIRAVDFWRNAHAQELLRSWTVRFLDDHEVVPFHRLQPVADRIVELAHHRHESLVR